VTATNAVWFSGGGTGYGGRSGTVGTGGGYGGGGGFLTAGTTSTGGGGGGKNSGGSGAVIISYASPTQRGTGGTVSSYTTGSTTYWVHAFTTSSSYTA
jgi:hypothetical protein